METDYLGWQCQHPISPLHFASAWLYMSSHSFCILPLPPSPHTYTHTHILQPSHTHTHTSPHTPLPHTPSPILTHPFTATLVRRTVCVWQPYLLSSSRTEQLEEAPYTGHQRKPPLRITRCSHSHTHTVTLTLSHSHCHIPTVTLPQSHSHCHTPTVTLPQSYSHCHTVTLPLSHSHSHPPTVTLSQHHTPTVTLPQSPSTLPHSPPTLSLTQAPRTQFLSSISEVTYIVDFCPYWVVLHSSGLLLVQQAVYSQCLFLENTYTCFPLMLKIASDHESTIPMGTWSPEIASWPLSWNMQNLACQKIWGYVLAEYPPECR